MEGIQQYQRAVTPTVSNSTNDSTQARGKIISYSNRKSSVESRASYQSANRQQRVPLKFVQLGQSLEISGQSRQVAGNRGALLSATRQDICGVSSRINDHESTRDMAKASSFLPRLDLEPFSEDLPPDGIVFARHKNHPESLVVFRLHEERARNPERLNLDRRQLEMCPQLEQEQRLRLLNLQNNNIRVIENIENLPNLIFLDLYNNKISSLEGSLSCVKGLRVLMVGKNRVAEIENLSSLKKLDVLDLHSNDIREVRGLDGLVDLRVLNLAGNTINIVQNLQSLSSLTELNLRRNCITQVSELDCIPALQRVFLSHNLLANERNFSCLYSLKGLIELSLDSNPFAEGNSAEYRQLIIAKIPSLKHMDLCRVMDDERAAALFMLQQKAPVCSSALLDKVMASARGGEASSEVALGTDRDEATLANAPILRRRSISSEHTALPASSTDAAGDDQGGEDVPALSTSYQRPVGKGEYAHTLLRVAPSLSQDAFELEIADTNEKAMGLLVTGERWEWAHSKRVLSSVTHVTLRHMRKDIITSKFAANMSWIPNASAYTFIENDIRSFTDLSAIFRALCANGNVIKHLVIRENPICQVSSFILRSYTLASLPSLVMFNQADVGETERATAVRTFRLLLFSSWRKLKGNAARFEQVARSSCTGSICGDVGAVELKKSGSGSDPSIFGVEPRKDLEYRYPYKKQPAGSGPVPSGPAGSVGNNTLVSCTVSNLFDMALRKRKAETKFNMIFNAAVNAAMLETVESLQGRGKVLHRKPHGRKMH